MAITTKEFGGKFMVSDFGKRQYFSSPDLLQRCSNFQSLSFVSPLTWVLCRVFSP